ncbi:MAG TPA: aldo/keto reductase [Solirubrobacteraceae bacterium]|nr:aldo/keto reductase [Solirubrobacteraceae bacterium]
MRVSELGFGAALLGNLYEARSDEQATDAVDAAWEGGVRYFDVAPHYGLGLAERRLGRALAGRPREQFVVSTKVGRVLEPNPAPRGSDLDIGGFAVPDALRRRRDYSAEGVRRSLHDSLERAGLDRVDVLLVHDPEEHMEQAVHEAVPALVALREQGVIGAVGVGMNLAEPLRRFVRETDIDVVLAAGRFTLIDRTAATLLDECAARGVSAVVAAPFNSGLLASADIPADARFDYARAPADVMACARACARICARHGVALPAAALRFGLRHPATACVLAGMGSAAEVRQNLAWLRTPIPDDLWAELPAPARA